jgi:uncharacterized membrane protein
MAYRRLIAASAVTAAGLAVTAALALARLPAGAQLPTHWNAAGQADRFADASTALFMPVVLVLVISLAFLAIPRIEPMQQRLERSEALLATAWASLLAVMVAVEAQVAAPAFGWSAPPTLVLVAIGLMLVAIGNALPKSRPGFFVGIRTPWALMDEDNWIATHRLGAWTFIAGGLIIVAAGLVPIAASDRAVAVQVAIAIAVVPPLVYSFAHWRRRHPARG